MEYLENLQILRDLYYHLSEKRIFFEYDYHNNDGNNRKLIEDYIKDYCEKRGLLNKYHYLVDNIWLLKIALIHGRDIQAEEFYGTLGLNMNDRCIKDMLEGWPRRKNDDWYKDWYADCWDRHWSKSENKEKFIQEYGKEYIDEIIETVEIVNNSRDLKNQKVDK